MVSRRVLSRSGRTRWVSWPALGSVLMLVLGPQPVSAAPGSLDGTFGIDGVVRTDVGGTYDWAYASAVLPDESILVAGVTNARGTHDFVLTRYTPAQQPDPSFGHDGMAVTDFGNSFDWAYALAVQPDGKVVVAGVSGRDGTKHFAMVRYEPDGTLDASFGDGGKVVERRRPLTTDIARGLVLQPDGKLLVAGVTFERAVTVNPQGDFMLARYLPDGSPDLTFGVGGIATSDFDRGSFDVAHAVALAPEGRIVLAGSTNRRGHGALFGADDVALARYTADGLLDRSFGNGGLVVIDGGTMNEAFNALAIAPDGAVIASGFVAGERRSDLLLARFGPDGALAPGWGNTGTGVSIDNLGTYSERLSSVVLQPDGTIVAGGQTATGHHADMAVFRYDTAGRLDRSFGHDGVACIDFGGREDRTNAVMVQADGRIVAVGQSETDIALAGFDGS